MAHPTHLSATPLRDWNSLRLEAHTPRLFVFDEPDALPDALRFLRTEPGALVLGAGSNVVFCEGVAPPVLAPRLRGRRIVASDSDAVELEVAAGEPWHDTVLWTLSQDLCGLENLALIPGLAGAAPVQNIGAYGAELSDCLSAVQVADRRDGTVHWLSAGQCGFGYRQSRFKQAPRRWLILALRMRLGRRFVPNLGHAELADAVATTGGLRAADVARAVMEIRRRKLPDPARLGNVGSFFKNPFLATGHARALADALPGGLPRFPVVGTPGRVKVPAARLIDAAGWKGRRIGDAGVHEAHALVLVNHGTARPQEIVSLARAIQADVHRRYAVALEPEPVLVRAAPGSRRNTQRMSVDAPAT